MNKITINHGTFQVDERVLDHGTITLGRTADNDVQMDDDTISAHHAQIVTVFTASYVEDLGSTNGTFVNGRRVIKHTLHSGDIITAGGYQLVFYSDNGAPKKAPEKTVMMSSARLEAMIAASEKSDVQGVGTEDSSPAVRKPSAGDTVIAVDNESVTHQDMFRGAAAHSTKHRGGHSRQSKPTELSDIENVLHARNKSDSGRRSLYVTIAATVAIVIVIIAIVLQA